MNVMISRSRFFLFAVLLLMQSGSAAEGYYKDVFINGGVYLSDMTAWYVDDSLAKQLQWEWLATKTKPIDSAINVAVMVGTPIDSNGVMLYPDGSPRFRMVFVNGGPADRHFATVGHEAILRYRQFYARGGSYAGSCGGSAVIGYSTHSYRKYDSTGIRTPEHRDKNDSCLWLWPGVARFSQVHGMMTSIHIPPESPLRKYSAFATNHDVTKLVHNGGNYVVPGDDYFWAPGTEVLAVFSKPITKRKATPDSVAKISYARAKKLMGKPVVWGYKGSDTTGRLLASGSHPEWGHPACWGAMVRYCLDGNGKPLVKAALKNGEPRIMKHNNVKGFEQIGDRQFHHFTVEVPLNTTSMTVALEGEKYDFNLYLKHGSFAFASTADTASTGQGSSRTIVTNSPKAGTWYVGVECATTVMATETDWGFEYSGSTDVLNGIGYSILADVGGGTPIASGGSCRGKNLSATAIGSRIVGYAPAGVHVRVFGLDGRLLAALEGGSEGMYVIDVGKTGISKGIYMVSLQSGKERLLRRVSVH